MKQFAKELVRPWLTRRSDLWIPGPLARLGIGLGWLWKRSRFFRQHPPERTFATRPELYAYLVETESLNAAVDYLEFGVFQGESLAAWTGAISHPEARFYGFDSFEGLPEDWGSMRKGTFAVEGRLPNIQDQRVRLVKGWFQDTLQGFLDQTPLTRRKIVHLDADLYSSTLYVLTMLARRLRAGDVLVFDEFGHPPLATHEFRAMQDFCSAYCVKLQMIATTQNYLVAALKIT